MPTFFSKSGSFKALTVTGSSLTVVSSSITFRNLTNNTSTNNVMLVDPSTGQLFTTASTALSASYALSTSYANNGPNFANTDLTFTGNRTHTTNGYYYYFYNKLSGFNITGGFQYFDSDLHQIGVGKGTYDNQTYINIDPQIITLKFNPTTNNYRFTSASAVFSSSLTLTGSLFLKNLTTTSQNNVVTIDTTTGQLFYTASSALGGGGGSTPNLQQVTDIGSQTTNTIIAQGGVSFWESTQTYSNILKYSGSTTQTVLYLPETSSAFLVTSVDGTPADAYGNVVLTSGTYTPIISSSDPSVTTNYSKTWGFYQKIGNIINVNLSFEVANLTVGTSWYFIVTLPIESINPDGIGDGSCIGLATAPRSQATISKVGPIYQQNYSSSLIDYAVTSIGVGDSAQVQAQFVYKYNSLL